MHRFSSSIHSNTFLTVIDENRVSTFNSGKLSIIAEFEENTSQLRNLTSPIVSERLPSGALRHNKCSTEYHYQNDHYYYGLLLQCQRKKKEKPAICFILFTLNFSFKF